MLFHEAFPNTVSIPSTSHGDALGKSPVNPSGNGSVQSMLYDQLYRQMNQLLHFQMMPLANLVSRLLLEIYFLSLMSKIR